MSSCVRVKVKERESKSKRKRERERERGGRNKFLSKLWFALFRSFVAFVFCEGIF